MTNPTARSSSPTRLPSRRNGHEDGLVLPSPSVSLSTIPSAYSSPSIIDGAQAPGTTKRFMTPSLNLSSLAQGAGAGGNGSLSISQSRLLTPGSRFGDGAPPSAFSSQPASRLASPTTRGSAIEAWGATRDDNGIKGNARLLQMHYGTSICLRGPKGLTLSVAWVQLEQGGQFRLQAEGKGLGDPIETFTISSTIRRDDKGPIHFGHVVGLRSAAAKEKFMSHNSDGQLVFARPIMGSAEKWTIARPDVLRAARSGLLNASTPLSAEAALKARGPLLAGDRVVLLTTNKQALVVRETPHGYEPGVVDLENALSSHATWEVSIAGAPHYPEWALSRPYITGEFLLRPERHRPTSAQEELFSVIPHPANRLEQRAPPLVNFPVPVQERKLVEELLWAVQGYEGQYIRLEATDSTGSVPASLEDVRFTLDTDSMDRSLAALASKFLPLAGAVVRVKHFIEVRQRYDYGMVSQALAAGLKVIVKDLAVLLSQLENKWLQFTLSLQRLWFHLQPSLRTFEILDTLCAKAAESKGGALLNVIHAAAAAGDERSTRTIEALLERASRPYMSMLEGWIYHGLLDDPYKEFMVREEQSLVKENVKEDFNAAYWDSRCTIQTEHVFRVLDDYRAEILTTGKYLNVIRECGRDVPPPETSHRLRYSSEGKAFFGEVIDTAYGRACKLLLDVVMKENQLIPRLMSIKHYFLLDKGDFFVHFMNTAEEELLKELSDVSTTRIESLLHLSVQMSVASDDPYKDDVSSTFASLKLINHLTLIHQSSDRVRGPADEPAGASLGPAANHDDDNPLSALTGEGRLKGFEALMLEYQVKWPLSLVISRRAVTKYQLLFRHLFLTKYVERRLHASWADQQSTKELDVRGALGLAYSLRHRMQHFIENYIYYMMFEVIEPHWNSLQESLRTGVQHVDDVIRVHQEFQDTCLKECLLTNAYLLKILNKITIVCMAFSGYMLSLIKDSQLPNVGDASDVGPGKVIQRTGSRQNEARNIRIREQSRVVQEQAGCEAFRKAMKALSETFDQQLHDFMCKLWDDSRLQHHSHLSNLCTRLDYNGWMSRKFGKGTDPL